MLDPRAESAGQGAMQALFRDSRTGAFRSCEILPPETLDMRVQRLANLGLMTAGLAHDLGNLAQAIVSGVHLAERRLCEDADPEMAALVRGLSASAARVADMTRRLLGHTRLAEAEAEEDLDVAAVIRALGPLAHWAAGPNVWVTVLSAGDEPRICCGRAGLENALLNLIVNAREAMPDGGALTIATFRETQDVPVTTIRVTDSGQGLSPEAAQRAFQAFYSGKADDHGSGLGLAIVGDFVRRAGGTVAFENSQRYGASIVMRFPGRG